MELNNLLWSAYGYHIDEEKLWFVNYLENLLCCYSIKEGKLLLLENIPYTGKRAEVLYSDIVEKDGKLILIPSNVFDIAVYDKKSRKFEMVQIDASPQEYNLFSRGVLYGNYVYLVPYKYKKMLRFNLKNYEIEEVAEFEIETNGEEMTFSYSSYSDERWIYFALQGKNIILFFDMKNNEYHMIEIGDIEDRFSALCVIDEKHLAIINQFGQVLILDTNTFEWEKKGEKYEFLKLQQHIEVSTLENRFSDCIKIENKIIFFPALASSVIEYSISEKTTKQIKWEDEILIDFSDRMTWNSVKFSYIKRANGNVIYGFYMKNRSFFIYDYLNENIKYIQIPIFFQEDEAINFIKSEMECNKLITENDTYLTLDIFLKMLQGVKG